MTMLEYFCTSKASADRAVPMLEYFCTSKASDTARVLLY
jgi:hypothetical protein